MMKISHSFSYWLLLVASITVAIISVSIMAHTFSPRNEPGSSANASNDHYAMDGVFDTSEESFIKGCMEASPEAPESISRPICIHYLHFVVNRATAWSLARLDIRLTMQDGKAPK